VSSYMLKLYLSDIKWLYQCYATWHTRCNRCPLKVGELSDSVNKNGAKEDRSLSQLGRKNYVMEVL
jgi:hypothetical protein